MSPPTSKQAGRIFALLRERHPDAECELNFSNPLELLVATVLSAQCTDERVNKVTADLFGKYATPEDYVQVPAEELEEDIRSTGFFRRKAKSLQAIMTTLIEEHGGSVPDSLDELTKLPGIGRKTANVVLGNGFGIPGITVDTHVARVSQRIGLTQNSDPEKIERDLMELFPEDTWTELSHTLIFHGRYLCKSRKPACDDCPVTDWCDYYRNEIESSG